MTRVLLLTLGFVVFLLLRVLPPVPYQTQLLIFLIGILLLGIPHGAADLLVANQNASMQRAKRFSVLSFLTVYVARLVLFALLFYFFPIVANLLFIFFAAYHFGETDLHHYHTNSIIGKIFVVSYGLLLLAVILLQHFDEVIPVFNQFESAPRAQPMISWIGAHRYQLMSITAVTFFVSCFIFFLQQKDNLPNHATGRFLIHYTCILFVLYYLPLLIGFTFYFVVWHSSLSLKNIITYLRSNHQNNHKQISKQIAGYSMLAIAGIALFGAAGSMFTDYSTLPGYLFLGLAVLTAPHMQVMHDMYNHMRSGGAAVLKQTLG